MSVGTGPVEDGGETEPATGKGCHSPTPRLPSFRDLPGAISNTLIQVTVKLEDATVAALPSTPSTHANQVPAVAGAGT